MSENINPSACSSIGLICTDCTASTARELASVCKGLSGKMLGQLFVQIHSHPACARMHAHFAEAYREASRPVQRKPAASEFPELPLAVAAVA